ncbi:MAG: hypothetical protein ACI906_002188 [Candidatus Latescibacterota bacterium]
MNWAFGVICIALIVILFQLMMIYNKRSDELLARQEPLRRRIQSHRKEIATSVERVQRAAESGLEEMGFSISELVEKNAQFKKGVEQLELQVQSQNKGEEEDDIEDQDPVSLAAIKEDDPRLVLRDAIRHREEVEININALKRDVEAIKRNMLRVNAKLKRNERKSDKK